MMSSGSPSGREVRHLPELASGPNRIVALRSTHLNVFQAQGNDLAAGLRPERLLHELTGTLILASLLQCKADPGR